MELAPGAYTWAGSGGSKPATRSCPHHPRPRPSQPRPHGMMEKQQEWEYGNYGKLKDHSRGRKRISQQGIFGGWHVEEKVVEP